MDVPQVEPLLVAAAVLTRRVVHDEDAVLGVVRLVRPGVVLEGVERAVTEGPDASPPELTEDHDEVGRDALLVLVDLLGLERLVAHEVPLMVDHRLDLRDQLVANFLVVGGRNDPLWLTPFHVQEETPVVPAVAPGAGLRPVDVHLVDRRDSVRLVREGEVTLLLQPLVEADAAHHGLRTVVRHHQHCGVFVGVLKNVADLGVEETVVLAQRLLVGVVALVARVVRVDEAPDPMVQTVGTHLDHHEEVPRLVRQQVVRGLELHVRHLVGLIQDVLRVVRPEVADVEDELADFCLDLLL